VPNDQQERGEIIHHWLVGGTLGAYVIQGSRRNAGELLNVQTRQQQWQNTI